MIFEASSANYGESLGNIASLKKITRDTGYQYTYISRQALRYNIVQQLGEPETDLSVEGSGNRKVIQFSKTASIKDYPEIDFFGYMKTEKGNSTNVRSAKVRLSNAISQEPFAGDVDFLTNTGLASRMRQKTRNNSVKNSLVTSEIHLSYYCYTITIDLDQIGIDVNDGTRLENGERSRRVSKLLDTIAYLYRDIRGRRENLQPLFIVGGVYSVKNPLFENIVRVENNTVKVDALIRLLTSELTRGTLVGYVEDYFSNGDEIKEKLKAQSVEQVIESLKTKVVDYYESN
ncbi:type I-B CRISPR-associated protein Cas7/Cst2/DevR [Liquorilactobacillus hordei]|uniref:type I-B CRISPR-associated protein Cas7/Cst2/DevR n=1 Tax=Liquorilactobacillus hordei TaxID=468911 RepID=UPI0039ECCA83